MLNTRGVGFALRTMAVPARLDAELVTPTARPCTCMPFLQGRATISKGLGAKGGVLVSDPRVNFLPFEEPVPGNPSRWEGRA